MVAGVGFLLRYFKTEVFAMLNREELEKVIEEEIRPGLQLDGGDIELVEVKDNKIYVKLLGACHGCPMSTMTLQFGIEQILKQRFPELEAVIPV